LTKPPEPYVLHTCIAGSVTHEIVVKKSRFICDLRYADDRPDAEAALLAIKKHHHSARHHCSAMIIGASRAFEKASDDGEPQGTAGMPMLEVLRGSGITNVIAIVTRYFGGTLLGTGGLARAYADSVKGALQQAQLVQNVPAVAFRFTIGYPDYGKLQSIAAEFGAAVDGEFLDQVSATVLLEAQYQARFEQKASEAFMGANVWDISGFTYIKQPVK